MAVSTRKRQGPVARDLDRVRGSGLARLTNTASDGRLQSPDKGLT